VKLTYAHFPGGGPPAKTCGDCQHQRAYGLSPRAKAMLWCDKLCQMTGKAPADLGHLNTATRACKYFVEKAVQS
jgi:hypothetical protein